jgi:AraC-like DNA-binding protein/mannose-6-phosphate isomerase-like protein (cupin superfamily)
MEKREHLFYENSVWITSTPNSSTKTLPFFAIEVGHFYTKDKYLVKRDNHDSYLFINTINGSGTIKTENKYLNIYANQSVIIDCHKYHEYYNNGQNWEFLWIHLNGTGVKSFFDLLYPKTPFTIDVLNYFEFKNTILESINLMNLNDISNCVENSIVIHKLLNLMLKSILETEQIKYKRNHIKDIEKVVDFIKNNYSSQINLNDMVKNIYVSKYHFIRIFQRIMGVTPYNYLTIYRINKSKTFLRTTDKTIEEISKICGFLDTSNFITRFKKYTNQNPFQYRRDFFYKNKY